MRRILLRLSSDPSGTLFTLIRRFSPVASVPSCTRLWCEDRAERFKAVRATTQRPGAAASKGVGDGMMAHRLRDLHRVNLSVTAARVRPGYTVTLSWKAVGVEANVASVHLTSSLGDGARMIEAVPSQSSREVIFAHPGAFSFALTVTFGDGVKRMRQVRVVVQE